MTSKNSTVLDRLIESIRAASEYNKHDQEAPAATLWTDGDADWCDVIGSISAGVPELLILDGDSLSDTAGPSTLLRYMINKNEGKTKPIIYIPGVSRQSFRGVAGFPESAKHLYALQFQSAMWTQKNGKDWTPLAFLASADGGLNLDIAEDQATKNALNEQLSHVLQTPITELSGRKLEASDFLNLAVTDPVRMMLQWISSGGTSKADMDTEAWSAFKTISTDEFGINPDTDGVITATGKLVEGGGKWDQVWERYIEAYAVYPGVRDQLSQIQPKDMFDENSRIPAINARKEDHLRSGLVIASDLPCLDATIQLDELCNQHNDRSEGLFAELGEAPLAQATVHLRTMLDNMQDGISGSDWEDLAQSYVDHAWKIDFSAWKAMGCASDSRDIKAISGALTAVYVPWLEELADRTSTISASYPNKGPENARTLPDESGTVVLFVDGLRADLGIELKSSLLKSDFAVELKISWAALPSITATSKPAWNPIAASLNGETIEEGMEPRRDAGGGPLRTADFRKLAADAGWKWLEADSVEGNDGAAWTEIGRIDHYGHDTQVMLASVLEGELDAIRSRVSELLESGWQKVIIVTDHGFLYVPSELPSVSLPKHLTISKWGRCALPSPDAHHDFSEVPWFWGGDHSVVLAPGISVFRKGLQYSHGGLTLQECLTPILTVTSGAQSKFAQISNISWVGLRCRIETTGAVEGFEADIRSAPMDGSSSMCDVAKPLDKDGKVALLVVDDLDEGKSAYVVLIDRNGTPVSQRPVTVGKT